MNNQTQKTLELQKLMRDPAAILALLAENKQFREDPAMRAVRSLRSDCTDLMAERDQLKAENEALRYDCQVANSVVLAERMDAERYRWLRDRCGIVEYKAIAGSIGPGMLPSGEKLEMAIDAVMSKGEKL